MMHIVSCTILPPTHALMAYYLAAERHQGPGQSNIWPYIAVLPQNFDTLPVCYPPCLLALLPKVVQGKDGCDTEETTPTSTVRYGK
jgi:hypothetical protein